MQYFRGSNATSVRREGLIEAGWRHNLADSSDLRETVKHPQESAPGASEDAENKRYLILLVEDNPADVFLVEQAVQFHRVPARLLVLDNGEEALTYLAQADANPAMRCPDLVLLDLNLPRRSGREVLEQFKQAGRCCDVPVIILTSSNSPDDRRETAALGAVRYFRKPTSYQEFLKIGEVLEEVLAETHS